MLQKTPGLASLVPQPLSDSCSLDVAPYRICKIPAFYRASSLLNQATAATLAEGHTVFCCLVRGKALWTCWDCHPPSRNFKLCWGSPVNFCHVVEGFKQLVKDKSQNIFPSYSCESMKEVKRREHALKSSITLLPQSGWILTPFYFLWSGQHIAFLCWQCWFICAFTVLCSIFRDLFVECSCALQSQVMREPLRETRPLT